MTVARSTGAVAAALLTLAVVGCSDDEPTQIELDGTPRIPDHHGVVAAADDEHLVLEDGTRFTYTDDFVSFATASQELVPVRGTVGAFVLLGTRGDDLAWLASVSQTVTVGDQRLAFYVGSRVETSDGRWVFADGTTLAVRSGLEAPTPRVEATIEIDPESGLATGVR